MRIFTGFFLLLLLAPLLHAAEEPANEAPEATLSESEQEAAIAAEIAAAEAAAGNTGTAASPASNAPLDENFVPSVQINEDLSVSFPVDI
jgi:hypothetical protein